MTLHTAGGLLRRDPRLDPEVVAPLALVRALHAFVGVACLQVALGGVVAGVGPAFAVVPGLILTASAVVLTFDRAWVRAVAIFAGWVGMAATLAGAIASPHLHALVAGLVLVLLWHANAVLGGAPNLDWRRMMLAPGPRPPARDRYDGVIEDLSPGVPAGSPSARPDPRGRRHIDGV